MGTSSPSSINHYFLLFLVTILLICFQTSSLVGASLIEQVCSHTRYVEVCISSLKSLPGSSHADIEGLARLSILLAWDTASDTFTKISELIDTTKEPVLLSDLGDCNHIYAHDLISPIQYALQYFSVKSYLRATQELTYAEGSPPVCEGRFRWGPNPRQSPLTKQNQIMVELCSITNDITRQLLH